MAKFGWAYIDCSDVGSSGSGSAGPPFSVQFVTESGGGTTGSALLAYYSGSGHGYQPSTMVLSGNLAVTGTISASHYHIEDIATIDATGSTFFGNSNDDQHIRTGSFVVIANGISPTSFTLSSSVVDGWTQTRGFGGRYRKVTANANIAKDDYIIGCSGSGNQVLQLQSGSNVLSGSLLIIKDEYKERSTTKIYISASEHPYAGGFQIDGESHYIMDGTLSAISLYCDGYNWFVF